MRPVRLLSIAILSAVLLAGCLPGALQDDTPDAAVLGVPANARPPGAADGLHQRLVRSRTGFDFVSAAELRFLEVRSGMVGSRVPSAAARVARSTGADVAVTVRAAVLERELRGSEDHPRERVALRLEAMVVRASDARELARLSGPRLSGERNLVAYALPALADDDLVAALIEESLDPLAASVARDLWARRSAFNGSTDE